MLGGVVRVPAGSWGVVKDAAGAGALLKLPHGVGASSKFPSGGRGVAEVAAGGWRAIVRCQGVAVHVGALQEDGGAGVWFWIS